MRRRADHEPPVLGPGHGDGARGEVEQHGRAGQGGLRRRRHRHPQVLAHLDVHDEPGDVVGREQQVRAERHRLVGERQGDGCAAAVVAGGEPALLVELAVVRQVRLGRDAEHAAALHDDGAVQQPVAHLERRPDDEQRPQVGARLDDRREGVRRRLQEGVREVQVVDRVPRDAQLGEDGDRDAVVVARARLGEDRGGVRAGVGDGDGDGAGRHAGEAVGVGRGEVHPPSVGTPPVPARLVRVSAGYTARSS